ncbi:MIF-like protein mif-2 [Centruroides vittatus]|uniref:MIF-like protein mif-2 n=1 Tax=Centruroides vittatus TaxID=120091 RepID=UPI00350FD133
MPLCTFHTNLPKERVPHDLHKQISDLISKILDKPEAKVTVIVHPDTQMCRGGSDDPTCMLEIWSIGVFSAEKNPKYSGPIYQFVKEKLEIAEDKIVIVYHDLKAEELAKPN